MFFLPRLRVKLTVVGYWMPSYMVSDCHHVGFLGSCKSDNLSDVWSFSL